MILFVLILGMILIKDAEIADSHTFSKDYMSIDNTNIITGTCSYVRKNGRGI